MTPIADLQRLVHQTAKEKGWWDHVDPTDPLVIGAKLALVHAEISEALEEVRKGYLHTYFVQGKPEGFEIEMADALIRILDLCAAVGVDLEDALTTKMHYNRNRPFRHGGKKL